MVVMIRALVDRLLPLAGVALLIGLWEVAVVVSGTRLVPTPLATLAGIAELARHGLLLRYLVASLFRVSWGYLGAVLLGVPAGLCLGWFRKADLALGPFLQILRPISPLAWIPLAILWFGVADPPAIFIIFLASFLPLTVATMSAVHNVPAVHLDVGRNFGLTSLGLVRRVLFPAVLPQVIAGLRLTLGISWLVVVAAEMIAVNSGLGFLIIDARNAGNRYDLVAAGMVLIGVTGLLLDTAMQRLERLPGVRWGYPDARRVDAAR